MKSYDELIQAAEQGNADAQANLGWMYFYGKGVNKSYVEAIKWYRKAAEHGYIGASICVERIKKVLEAQEGKC